MSMQMARLCDCAVAVVRLCGGAAAWLRVWRQRAHSVKVARGPGAESAQHRLGVEPRRVRHRGLAEAAAVDLAHEIDQAEGHLALITHSADLIYTNVMGPVGIDSLSNIL